MHIDEQIKKRIDDTLAFACTRRNNRNICLSCLSFLYLILSFPASRKEEEEKRLNKFHVLLRIKTIRMNVPSFFFSVIYFEIFAFLISPNNNKCIFNNVNNTSKKFNRLPIE